MLCAAYALLLKEGQKRDTFKLNLLLDSHNALGFLKLLCKPFIPFV